MHQRSPKFSWEEEWDNVSRISEAVQSTPVFDHNSSAVPAWERILCSSHIKEKIWECIYLNFSLSGILRQHSKGILIRLFLMQESMSNSASKNYFIPCSNNSNGIKKKWHVTIKNFINCNSKQVVYLITCTCQVQYVGCTSNLRKIRIRRHFSDATNPTSVNKSAVSRHFSHVHQGDLMVSTHFIEVHFSEIHFVETKKT